MLKITSGLVEYAERIEFDYYIPFKIRLNSSSSASIWTTTQKNTLFEVVFDSFSGAIDRITLVNVEKENIKLTNEKFSINPINIKKNEKPICDLKAKQKKQHIREENKLKLIIGSNFLRLQINDTSTKKYYAISRTYIGINEHDELVEVAISEISKEEMRTLKECLHLEA